MIRTYDSRDKRKGDFGVGWTLSLKNIRLEKSVELGRYWWESISPGTLPSYCLQPTRPNIITITFPHGRVYKFQATVVKRCQSVSPLTFAQFAFTPMPGTRGTLVPQGPVDILVEGAIPGPVELLDAANAELATYDPTVFRFTDENGIAYVIDQKAGVRSMTDRYGNKLTINSDGITHSSGKSVRFVRDSLQRIIQIIDPSGNPMSYTYDDKGDLIRFTDREGNQTSFSYNDTHGMLSITDPSGVRTLINEYDSSGRLISQYDSSGNKVSYNHDLASRREIIADRLGNFTVYEYDLRGNVTKVKDPLGNATSYTYDSRNNKLTETNALGHTTTFTYDLNNNMTGVTDPLGNTTRYTYNSQNRVLAITDARGGITTNTYDARGSLTSTRNAAGNTTTYTRLQNGQLASLSDAMGGVFRYEYNSSGNLTKFTDSLGNAATYTYDAGGNRLSETQTRTTPAGQEAIVTTFERDKLNRIIKSTHADGSISRATFNSTGLPTAMSDQLGRITSFEYDSMGRVTKTTHPDGASESVSYDAEGRKTSTTDRAGRVITFTYDPLGRIIKSKYPDGTSSSTAYDAVGRISATTDELGHTTSLQYDQASRRTAIIDALNRVTRFTYDAKGNQTSITNPNNQTTRFEYDLLNRRTGVVHADNTTAMIGYDALGRTASQTDQAGKTTRFDYDKRGSLIKVTDALNQTTQYSYDELGNRVAQTDTLGRTTRFEYDKVGRRTRRILPLGQAEAYAYDLTGNLISRTDFGGKTSSYSYDSFNQLVRKSPDPGFNEAAVTFTYTPSGRRAAMTDANGTTTYTYDLRDRLLSKATPQGTLRYTYDAAGNQLSVQSSNTNGVSVTYSYDKLNRLATVTDNTAASGARPGTGNATYSYDAAGNLAGYTYPNGVRTDYTYNSLNRLTNVTAKNASASLLSSYAYTLGPTGNRLSVSELSGRAVTYSYDELFRLTGETVNNDPVAANNGAISYSYDAVGNRLNRASSIATLPSASYAYDANDRLASDEYNSAGNTTSSGGNTYVYDSEDRLTGVNNGQVAISYDGDGNRVSKKSGGVTTNYLVDDNNPTGHAQVVEEIVSGSVKRVYVYGHALISQSQFIDGKWAASFYGYDGHGSVRFLTNQAGNITDTYTYDAFGALVHSTGDTPNSYLYAGEQMDPNLGFYYLRARYMNPATGRFWTMDSFEGISYDPFSLHKYLYVNANPINLYDPSGHLNLVTQLTLLFNRMVMVAMVAPYMLTTYYITHMAAIEYWLTWVQIGFDMAEVISAVTPDSWKIEVFVPNTNPPGEIGAQGEAHWVNELHAKGFTEIVQIQNASGHGIDVVASDPLGNIHFFEVKATDGSTAPPLSAEQGADPRRFIESRLQRAIDAQGQWQNVAGRPVQSDAIKLMGRLNGGARFFMSKVQVYLPAPGSGLGGGTAANVRVHLSQWLRRRR